MDLKWRRGIKMASFQKIKAITKKNFQELLNDKRSLGMLIGLPVVLMLLFGFGLGEPIKDVPIKVANLDSGDLSKDFITILDENDKLHVSEIYGSGFDLEEEKSKIFGPDDYFALLVIPENFSIDIVNPNKSIPIDVYIYGSDVASAGSVRGGVAESIGNLINQMSGSEDQHLNVNIIYITGSEDLRPLDTMAQGVISYAILIFMILTVTGGLTKERISGTSVRTLTTPATKTDIILGYLLGNSLIAMVQVSILILISKLVFDVVIIGSLLNLFIVLFVYAISGVGLGILLSAYAKNQLQAFQFIPIVLIPMMLFSGFMFPIRSMPVAMQYVSKILPMTYSIRISRIIALDGYGWDHFYMDFIYLLILTVIFVVISILGYKKKRN